MAIFSLGVCLCSCIYHFIRLLKLGKPEDYAMPAKKGNAISYSFIGAMNPTKKESAYLHFPTYTAGIFFHLGTFLSIFLFFFFLFWIFPAGIWKWIIFGFLVISGLNGLGIFIKRIVKKELRSLSNPDDYISNLLVSGFHLLTAAVLIFPLLLPVYFVEVSVLLLYLPLGKLKHTVYFFAARYHLGYFFGWRGVWPPNKIKY